MSRRPENRAAADTEAARLMVNPDRELLEGGRRG